MFFVFGWAVLLLHAMICCVMSVCKAVNIPTEQIGLAVICI